MNHNGADFRMGPRRESLRDWLGHRPAGPLDDRPDDARHDTDRHFAEWRCSVCGHMLGEHVVDHSGEHTLFECPVSAEDSIETEEPSPLTETGQTKFGE